LLIGCLNVYSFTKFPYFVGDLLYLPRGTVHQASCSTDVHSLHLTVSAYQKNSWIDLLEKAIPQALQLAAESHIDFRKGLPRGYLHYMGVENQDKADEDEEDQVSDEENGEGDEQNGDKKKKKRKREEDDDEEEAPKYKREREEFISYAQHLVDLLKKYLPLDAAADQMGKVYQHSALPPFLLPAESEKTVVGRKQASLILTDDIRLVRKHAFRIAMERDAEGNDIQKIICK
jgi:bifunctional lysine-specific demethylase and histidyl-hydroxylase NO66